MEKTTEKLLFELAKDISIFTNEKSINNIHIYSCHSEYGECYRIDYNCESSFTISFKEIDEDFINGEWVDIEGEFYNFLDLSETDGCYIPISKNEALHLLEIQFYKTYKN